MSNQGARPPRRPRRNVLFRRIINNKSAEKNTKKHVEKLAYIGNFDYLCSELKNKVLISNHKTMEKKTYKIVGRTNGYIASRDIEFNGKTEIVIERNLNLKEAQAKLLDFFNGDYESCFQNWGLARCNHPFVTSSFSDGTRSYEYDSRIYSIEIDE